MTTNILGRVISNLASGSGNGISVFAKLIYHILHTVYHIPYFMLKCNTASIVHEVKVYDML